MKSYFDEMARINDEYFAETKRLNDAYLALRSETLQAQSNLLEALRETQRNAVEAFFAANPILLDDPKKGYEREIALAELIHAHELARAALCLEQQKALALQKLQHETRVQELKRIRDEALEQLKQKESRRREQERQERHQRWEGSSNSDTFRSRVTKSSRAVTDAERSAHRTFISQFHPDRHEGRPYQAQLLELTKQANIAWDTKPMDLQKILTDLTRQAQGLVN